MFSVYLTTPLFRMKILMVAGEIPMIFPGIRKKVCKNLKRIFILCVFVEESQRNQGK